jgi:hypothetical protein
LSTTLSQHGGFVANIDLIVAIYLGGWVLVALAGYIASRWFAHTWSPPAHPLLVSALAGAVWPLLLIGLIEFSSIVVLAHRGAKREAWLSSPRAPIWFTIRRIWIVATVGRTRGETQVVRRAAHGRWNG